MRGGGGEGGEGRGGGGGETEYNLQRYKYYTCIIRYNPEEIHCLSLLYCDYVQQDAYSCPTLTLTVSI